MGIINVSDLTVKYKVKKNFITAVAGVSLDISAGESAAIVGESGCGKTTLANALLKLLPENAVVTGSVFMDAMDVLNADEERLRSIRGKTAGMIFQEPGASLNPLFSIKQQIEETLTAHFGKMAAPALEQKSLELLNDAGITDAQRVYNSYPHQLSGGLQQRVMAAIALSCNPKILIADEPTTALDVTVQAQIVELLKKLKEEHNLTLLLITHDLHLANELASRIIVMYAGEIAEDGAIKDKKSALHPYTAALFEIIPSLDSKKRQFTVIPGEVARPREGRDFCAFSPRCPYADDKCRSQKPELIEVKPGHFVRCFYPGGKK
ncbi:MAG: peptide ABC transporter ATP-binding protein [Candidatus Goldiibacteriota bacterium HGW-Goldbacteria-1]|jgi:oligopeptide/dipeptide ABC transporter ATP-binding protein|nr:MAG: peptide ABC transporter ATP-binding protein [Candidatus Goldiibacteriota bacterium HGW-Goldbacteria-1]